MSSKPSSPSTWKLLKEHVPAGTKIIGLVPLVLIVLKLFKVPPVANWSWWWLLSPYWLAAAGGLIVMLGMFAVFYFFDR